MNVLIIVTFVLLLLVMASFPYKVEDFEMEVDLNKMSCLDLLNTTQEQELVNVYKNIRGNSDRTVTVADLDRAVKKIPTADGNIFPDTTYCILRKDKLQNYNMDMSCSFSTQTPGKNVQSYPWVASNSSQQPDGCIIDPRNSQFVDFLDDAFYVKNKKRIDEITDLTNQNNSLQRDKDDLINKNKSLNSQISDYDAKTAKLTADFNDINSKYNTCNSRPQTTVVNVTSPPPPPPPPPSNDEPRADGRCGPEFGGARCRTDQCCSIWGWCDGPGSLHCGAAKRSDTTYDGERSDGRCGPEFENKRCRRSNCCSIWGWCDGPGTVHCGQAKRSDTLFDG